MAKGAPFKETGIDNALRKLVSTTMSRRGWDDAALAARAPGLSRQTVQRYRSGRSMTTLPQEKTLRQLSTALDVPYDEVLKAAYASLSHNQTNVVTLEPDVMEIQRLLKLLTEKDRETVLALCQALVPAKPARARKRA